MQKQNHRINYDTIFYKEFSERVVLTCIAVPPEHCPMDALAPTALDELSKGLNEPRNIICCSSEAR